MKKSIKRAITLILPCVLLLAMLATGALAANGASHWATEYVQSAVSNGWIEDGSVSPDKALTRGEFAVILWKTLGGPDAQSANPFPDVTEDEQVAAVAALADLGVVEGYNGKFFPDDPLARQEGITMLARAFDLKPANKNAAASYSDWANVSEYAQDAIAATVEKGIVNGIGNNLLAPTANITLGEMAKLTVVTFDSLITTEKTVAADDVIKSVYAIGFVDMDGSKTKAIAIEYSIDLTGAALGTGAFDIDDYGLTLTAKDLVSGGDAGKPLTAYVNDKAEVSATGGSGTGNYVIIEVNTDYLVSRFPRSYAITVLAGAAQTVAIRTDDYVITPSTEKVVNYHLEPYIGIDPNTGGFRDPEYYNYAYEGTYTIEGIEGYELHYIDGEPGHEAFQATNCFDEADGQRYDFQLPYAIFVPDDYDDSLEYALVLHIHDAGSMSSDPMLTLTEAQGPANYASDEFQQLFKDQGLGGAIVVCPAIEEMFDMDGDGVGEFELRMARDNWTFSCGSQAIWELMDSVTEKYNIDDNRIYGSGQSMGGMTVMGMAAQRDNYFAAILPMSCQWGQNFNKDYEFNGTVYYNAPAGEGEVINDIDSDGNPYDYNNWYYVCSDDNILFIWTDELPEFMLLYRDLCGVNVESATMLLDPDTNVTDEERSALVNELVNRDSELGFRYIYLTGSVGHMSAWFYGHGTSAVYEWLASQTRDSEMERDKLDLNKPFVLAEVQNNDKLYKEDKENPENNIYYPTGAFGSGTQGYNSACSALGSSAYLAPGWTPDD